MTMRMGGGGRDEARFEAIYRKHYGRVFRYFRRSGVSDDEAHDLAQQTFTRFFEKMEQYRGDAEWGFLETTALNVLRNWVRARRTAKRTAKIVDIDDPEFTNENELAAPAEPDYAEQQEEALHRRQLHGAIGELSEGQRQCMKLWLEGLQYNEIAEVLRISMDAVRSRLRDGKRILSARLGGKFPENDV